MMEFDEAYYLDHNPDVAEAVRKGEWPSGLTHYCVSGKAKGRKAAPVVEVDWYLGAYPQAALEIAAGKVTSVREHFHTLGKYRGYLPSPRARRPPNPAMFHSRYGGLWTDVGNALDIIAGRLDIGQIDAEQAAVLTSWVTDGYVILRNAVPDAILDGAQADLERAYRNDYQGLRFAMNADGESLEWSALADAYAAQALDLHWFSGPIRQAIFTRKVLAFLHLIFERRVLATQSLGIWRGAAQPARQDSARLNYSLPMQFVASRIALEDVPEGTGEPYQYKGSQHLAEYRYRNEFKGVKEATRMNPGADLTPEYRRHLELIDKQANGIGLSTERFAAKRGDILVWSADLASGEDASLDQQTRKSIVTYYCPAEVVPHYFEATQDRQIKSFAATAFYSSGNYS